MHRLFAATHFRGACVYIHLCTPICVPWNALVYSSEAIFALGPEAFTGLRLRTWDSLYCLALFGVQSPEDAIHDHMEDGRTSIYEKFRASPAAYAQAQERKICR